MGNQIDKSSLLEAFEEKILNGHSMGGDGQMGSLIISILSAHTSAVTHKQNIIFHRQMEKIATEQLVKKMKDPTATALDIATGVAHGAAAGLSSHKLNGFLPNGRGPMANLAEASKANVKTVTHIAEMTKTGSGISSRFSQAGAEEKRAEKSLAEEARRTADAAHSKLHNDIDGLMQMIAAENRAKHDTARSMVH